MILKKPYAFLIKYFRIIHIILAIPIIYLIVRTGNIVGFFSDYIEANYYTSITNIAGTFINYFMYLSVLLILIAGIFIYFLMRKKEKSTKFYFFLLSFYVILLVLIGITHSILSSMETTTMSSTAARAYRDISYIFYIPQFFFAAFTIFRGIGFDIKKFNFDIDIKELEITEVDSEEFELTLGVEDYKIKRNIRRFIREFKYYVKENKFIFSILCAIVIIIFGTIFYLNFEVYNKKYRQSQVLSHNNFNIEVTGSMLTNRDYSGNIFKDNKYYLVLQLSIENRGKTSKTLDYKNFFIELKKSRIYPILDRASYFLDYGESIREDTELKSGSKNTYVLAYEMPETELKKEYTLKILEQITYQVGEITPQYKVVSLKPYHAINIENIESINIGKIATFEESNIGYSSLQIKNYQLTDSYSYQYEYCYQKEQCRNLTERVSANKNTKTILALYANYSVDETTLYYKSARTDRLFPEHFLSIEYQINGDKKTQETTNRTPTTLKNGFLLEVPKEMESAEKINLVVTVRDKRYLINLK